MSKITVSCNVCGGELSTSSVPEAVAFHNPCPSGGESDA